MTESCRTIAALMADHMLITTAATRAVREAVLGHARAGHPVATSQDGKVVWVPAGEVLSRLGQADANDHEKANGGPGATG